MLNIYEKLLVEADEQGLITREKPLEGHDRRIKENKIAIRIGMTTAKKSCVLTEELGHYYTSVGNILDQQHVENIKQENRARMWAYDKQIRLMSIINSYKRGCKSLHEMADFLDVTENFLKDALEAYRLKYSQCMTVGNYILYFESNLYIADINF